MLNDEEKKAIERIDYIQDFIIENGQYNADVNDMEYFSRILDLIEKQSKEIEKLNLENVELKQSKIVDKNSIPNQDNFYDCYNFIHKDKIKAKIEPKLKELDEQMQEEWEYFGNSREYQDMEDDYNFLQSLLGKE